VTQFEFDRPQRFVAGTVGQPGEREFYLQARNDVEIVSVALDKEQVRVLAERVDALLNHVLEATGASAAIPAMHLGSDDLGPLEVPIESAFQVQMLSITWDSAKECVTIEASSEEEGSLTVHLSGFQARAFAHRAVAVVSAGRKPCPICSQPLDPRGHLCPRANGYRRR
jgi:hypothetical protein